MFLVVYKGMWSGTTPVALKTLKEAGDMKEFEKEFSMLMKFNHPCVVRCLGLFKGKEGQTYMVLEYLSKGSLLEFLKKPGIKGSLQQQQLIQM
jgi:serine/threonine protein kinase